MISEQIKKLKKSTSNKIQYSNSDDIDTESLLDLVSDKIPRTKYLSSFSLHFDRLRLTNLEEIKFNRKFKTWMKSLLVYGKLEGYEYLLDFLVRKYHVNKYNQHELLFITLPFARYYKNKLTIFEYLQNQNTYSTEFIAECLAKYLDFFNFFIDYFDYYEDIRDFINEVMEFFLVKNKINMHKYINEINEIKIKLEKYNEVEMIKKIDNALDGNFHNFYETDKVKVIENYNQNIICFKNNQGRYLVTNIVRLKEYILWLHSKKYIDTSFSDDEYNLLLKAFLVKTDYLIKDTFEIYKNIFEGISCREVLVKILHDKFKAEIIKIDQNIYEIYDKNTILIILSEKNYKQLLYKDYDILLKCMNFVNFDPDFFTNIEINYDDLYLFAKKNKNDKIFIRNFVHFCNVRNIQNDFIKFDLSNFKTLGEENIENCTDYHVIHYQYKKDKNIINRITNKEMIYNLCLDNGYEEILNNFDISFIINFSNEIKIDIDYLNYLINRFTLEDILDILKVHYCKLIHFVQHKNFKKMKIIIKELANNKTDCKYILDVFFNNLDLYKEHLDLLYLYKLEYKFINNYKDSILDICTLDIDIMDYFICFTDYGDIRIINKISKDLIIKNKSSILILFKNYGNIMKMYIKDFIEKFNYKDYPKDLSLIKVDNNEIIRNVINNKKITDYEYLIIQMLKSNKNINIDLFNDPEDVSDTLIYCILKYKYINDIKFDDTKMLQELFITNLDLFMKLTKFYTEDIKNEYFNIILKDRKYDRINKHFSDIQLENDNIIYEYLQEYYNEENIEKEISYLNSRDDEIRELSRRIYDRIPK